MKRKSSGASAHPKGMGSAVMYMTRIDALSSNALCTHQSNDGWSLDQHIQHAASHTEFDLVGNPIIAADPTRCQALDSKI